MALTKATEAAGRPSEAMQFVQRACEASVESKVKGAAQQAAWGKGPHI